jgi:hypothetical protein
MSLGLPASRQQPGKFGFIGEYHYVGVSQRKARSREYLSGIAGALR